MAEMVIAMAGCLIVLVVAGGCFVLGWWAAGKAGKQKRKPGEAIVEKEHDKPPLEDQIANMMNYTGRDD